MKKIYAPWRSSYVKAPIKDGCPFCNAINGSDDDQSFILARGQETAVMLNRYPYNAGHLLIIPNQHHADLALLTTTARNEMMETVTRSVEILKDALQCDGVNVGVNLGISSGGSIPDHLHMHVLPRWQGDTNFLAALGDTKLVSYDLHEMYKKLKGRF